MGSSGEIAVRIGPGLEGRGDKNTHNHQKRSLDLEFFIDPLALYWIVFHLLVEAIAPGCFDDTMGEDLAGK